MAFSVGNSSSGQNTGLVSTLSFAHNNNGNLLVVGVFRRDSTAGDRAVSTLTYNGVSLTHYTGARTSNDDMEVDIWYLVNPDSGSNTLALTLGGNNSDLAMIALSIIDAYSTPIITAGIASGATGNPAVGLTTKNANSIVFGIMASEQIDSLKVSVDSPGVEVIEEDVGTRVYTAQYEVATAAGSYVLNWTDTDADETWAATCVEITDSVYTPAGSSIKTINGLAIASVKTVDGLAIASVKNYNGLA